MEFKWGYKPIYEKDVIEIRYLIRFKNKRGRNGQKRKMCPQISSQVRFSLLNIKRENSK